MKKLMGGIVILSCSVLMSATASAATAEVAVPASSTNTDHCDFMHRGSYGGKYFAAMDTNNDGAISKQEFDDFHDKHFKELDTNNDGKISREEFDAAHSGMYGKGNGRMQGYRGGAFISKHFAAADSNHDGALTREEAKSMPMVLEHFDEIDANKDGKVSEQELKDVMQGRQTGADSKNDKSSEKK